MKERLEKIAVKELSDNKEFWIKETQKAKKQLEKLEKEFKNSFHALEVVGDSREIDEVYKGQLALRKLIKKADNYLKGQKKRK